MCGGGGRNKQEKKKKAMSLFKPTLENDTEVKGKPIMSERKTSRKYDQSRILNMNRFHKYTFYLYTDILHRMALCRHPRF